MPTRTPRCASTGLAVDPAGREVEANGAAVALSSLEFDLLAALARAPGRVFSRAQLLEQVWGYDFYGDERVVDVHIRSLRAAARRRRHRSAPDRHRARRGVQVRRQAGMTMRLPMRLFISYAGVAVVGAVVAYLTVRLLAPPLFDHQVGMMNGAGMGMATHDRRRSVHAAFVSALNTALIIGVLASVAAAVVIAWLRHPPAAAPARTRCETQPGRSPPAATTERPASRGAGTGRAGHRRQHPRPRPGRHRVPAHPPAR